MTAFLGKESRSVLDKMDYCTDQLRSGFQIFQKSVEALFA